MGAKARGFVWVPGYPGAACLHAPCMSLGVSTRPRICASARLCVCALRPGLRVWASALSASARPCVRTSVHVYARTFVHPFVFVGVSIHAYTDTYRVRMNACDMCA